MQYETIGAPVFGSAAVVASILRSVMLCSRPTLEGQGAQPELRQISESPFTNRIRRMVDAEFSINHKFFRVWQTRTRFNVQSREGV